MFYNLKNMKKFLLFICILCNCISAHSQMVGKGSLGYYGLRGPVKTCKEIGENWECTHAFDKNGVLTAVDGESVRSNPPSYEFNANGRISRFFPIPENPNLYEKYEYDASGRLIKSTDYDSNYVKNVTTFIYNAQGHCIKSSYIAYGPHGGKGVYTYKILETDKYGNWTKRSMGDITTTRREITYYE